MSTQTIVVKATRVTTFLVREGANIPAQLVMSAFQPAPATVFDLKVAVANERSVHIEISDETGEYMTGALWFVTKLDIASDAKAFNLLLTKA